MEIQPTLHRPVPMGTRVKIPNHYHSHEKEVWGVVQGVAMMHVIFTYIIVLDGSCEVPGIGEVKAVAVPGSELEGENGGNWRLENV